MARSGYTAALAELVERGSDSDARLLVEVIVTETKDTKDAQADYDAADSLTGLTTLEEGGVRITGSDVTSVEQATDTGGGGTDITAGLSGPWGAAIGAVVVEWADAEAEQEIHSFEARLHPNNGGGGVEVEKWVAQLFRLDRVSMDPFGGGGTRQVWTTTPISGQVRVTAVSILSTISFIFTTDEGETPRVGGAPIIEPDVLGATPPTRPTTIALVWALKDGGDVAGNVAWRTSSGIQTVVNNGHTVSRYDFERTNVDDRIELGDRMYSLGTVAGVPRFAFKGKTFSQKTITWTTAPLDLGAAPTGAVGMILEADEVGTTTVDAEVWDGAAWVGFQDGDLLGVDNTPGGGADLSGVATSQTKDVRCILNPSGNGSATPILRRLGMEERTSEVLSELVAVSGYSVTTDPITLASSIPTAELTLYKSGARDYRDFATELLSENFAASILFRLWWGHLERLDRKDWLFLEDFGILDVRPADGAIVCDLVHPLERLRRKIPVLDTVANERTLTAYEAKSLKFVFDDLLDGQIGLPGRLIGPGITDDATLVGAELVEGPGVDELDRIHFLDGSTGIASQGRYKTRKMFDRSAPRAVFNAQEIAMESISAGYPSRITDYVVRFGWDKRRDAGRGAWTGEVYASSAKAIARLGRAHLDTVDELDTATAKWIPHDTPDPPTSALATTVASRMLEHAAGGVVLWTWRSTGHARPWLENGDRVAVPTDLFVGLDPARDGQPIRGPVWAIVRLVGCHSLDGTRFTGWVQDYTDILPGSVEIDRVGFSDPMLITWAGLFLIDGSLRIQGQLSSDALGFRAISHATAFQVRAVVAGEAVQATDSQGHFDYELDPATTWDFDDDAFISLVAYEKADGTGAESSLVYQLKRTRDPTQLDGWIRVEVDTANQTLDVHASAIGPTSLFPAELTIYQDDPTGAALQVHEFAASLDTIGPTGSGATAEYVALTDITLPKKGALRFFGTLVSASGAVTPLFSMGDLDSLPEGAVTATDFAAAPTLRMAYDDDVAEIVVTVPGPKFKTFTPLSGGGVEVYTVGDTLDDVTTEALLTEGEERTGYLVTVYAVVAGAGLSKVIFDGSLHGEVGVDANRLMLTGAQWYAAAMVFPTNMFGYQVNVSPGPDTLSMKVDYDPGSGAVSYTRDFSGAELHVLKITGGATAFLVDSDQLDFDVTFTPYTGLAAAGDPGTPVIIATGDSERSGLGTAAEDSSGTVIHGNFLAFRPAFEVLERTADDEPELGLRASFNAGAGTSFGPSMINGPSQYFTATGACTVSAPGGLSDGESMLLRIVTGGNTVTFSGYEGPRDNWSAGTIWATVHNFAGTYALLGAAG